MTVYYIMHIICVLFLVTLLHHMQPNNIQLQVDLKSNPVQPN